MFVRVNAGMSYHNHTEWQMIWASFLRINKFEFSELADDELHTRNCFPLVVIISAIGNQQSSFHVFSAISTDGPMTLLLSACTPLLRQRPYRQKIICLNVCLKSLFRAL